jgi:mRNA interferase YafQ
MLSIEFTNKMKRDVRRMIKRGKDRNKLEIVLDMLTQEQSMPMQYHDHQLTGNLKDFRECHIEPDWLLLYQVFKQELILSATGTGTHADLFAD